MDYIIEAQKFIQRAQDASNREVINQDLAMAAWCLSEAIKERDGPASDGPHRLDSEAAGHSRIEA